MLDRLGDVSSVTQFTRTNFMKDGKTNGHNLPGSAGPGGKVGLKEGNELCGTCLCGSVGKVRAW
jgi:hypothetical protein